MQAQVIILQYICPILGIILAQIMFAAPLQSVRESVKKGSLGVLNPAPWAIMTGNCLGWVGYSYLTRNIFVLVGNFFGVLISLWLNMCAIKLQYHDHTASMMRQSMASFLINTRESIRSSTIHQGGSLQLQDLDSIETAIPATTTTTDTPPNPIPSFLDSRIQDLYTLVQGLTATENIKAPAPQEKILITLVTFWLFLFSLIAFIPISIHKKILIVGIFANLNTFFFYAAPLSTMVTVLRTKSSISIHRRTMIMNTANGTFWSAYGLAVSDVFITIPNSIGAILGVVQIVLCIVFPSKGTLTDELLDKSIATVSYGTDNGEEKEQIGILSSNHDKEILNHSSQTNDLQDSFDRKSTVRFSGDPMNDSLTPSSTNTVSILKNPISTTAVRFSLETNEDVDSSEQTKSSVANGEQDDKVPLEKESSLL